MKMFKKMIVVSGGIYLFFMLISIPWWVKEKFDPRTPEQRQEESRQELLRQYNRLKRGYPSMEIDGKVTGVDIEWLDSEMRIILPKTYGFTATRFVHQVVSIAKDDIYKGERYRGHIFVPISVQVWSGPTQFPMPYYIAIPEYSIPSNFRRHLEK